MKHVFIAVGGSGTKVAEALVRLLAVGFPTRSENGALTSAGDDSLQIWRVDPDQSAGAAADLKECLEDYRKLQSVLSDGNETDPKPSSRWAMEVDTRIRELNPLQLESNDGGDNQIESLSGILDSRYGGVKTSEALLAPFFEPKDLKVKINRGFYQKPFIGSAVMSIFARSLESTNSPGGREAGLPAFHKTETNFFLCGSLHGGTGACGVPVLGQFLNRQKEQNPGWRVGGCLLAPFVKPPNPPFNRLEPGQSIENVNLRDFVDSNEEFKAASSGMNDEEKIELARQILLGFFADPDDMELRARQGLAFYKDHGADYFDQLYLVGKPEPNKLTKWSNGGQNQRNPLNSADTVAALAALNFFTRANAGRDNSYVVGSSGFEIPQENMLLKHLPSYKIGDTEIDPEKVFLATALTHHLLEYHFNWEKIHESVKDFRLAAHYDSRGAQRDDDKKYYKTSLNLIRDSMKKLVNPHQTNLPTGWSVDNEREIEKFFSENASEFKTVKENLDKPGWFSKKKAKGVNTLGQSGVEFMTSDYAAWCPKNGEFTRGEYLRHVWQQIYQQCQTQLDN